MEECPQWKNVPNGRMSPNVYATGDVSLSHCHTLRPLFQCYTGRRHKNGIYSVKPVLKHYGITARSSAPRRRYSGVRSQNEKTSENIPYSRGILNSDS
jgi:hypothetical protein